MKRYDHVVNYVRGHAWAILPETLQTIAEVVQVHVRQGGLSAEDVAERLAAGRSAQGPRDGKRTGVTAVIPIYGVIMPRATLMSELSGATSVEGLRADFRAALADPDVARIVFDVDSPGGSVEGIEELGEEIRAARGQKPMTAVANYLMASAAYWLASQADEIVASPSSLVGSIGVYAVHQDWSAAYEQAGVKPTLIKAGKYKAEGIDFMPLSDDAIAHFQESVDDSYEAFTAAVAKGRGTTPAAVRSGYGEGRALTARRAKAEGLVDRIDTLEGSFSRTPKMRAVDDAPAVTAGEPTDLDRIEMDAADYAGLPDDAFAFEVERRRRQGLRHQ
jgi:signal peptide peptidase SppA